MVKKNYDAVIAQQVHTQHAMSLIHEFWQEAEQLTYLVRIYASTGQSKYLKYYSDIIAIRQGKKSPPENYVPNVYWGRVIAGEVQPEFSEQSERRSISNRIQLLTLNEDELNIYSKVVAASDALIAMDQAAISSIQANHAEVAEINSAVTRNVSQLVYGAKYGQLKFELTKSLAELTAIVEQRSSAEVENVSKILERWVYLTFGSVLLSTILVLILFQMTLGRILQPIVNLSQAAKRLAQGDYSTRAGIGSGTRSAAKSANSSVVHASQMRAVEELVVLGETFDSMAEAFEQDIKRQHQAQRELELANQKAEEASRAKSMFLANMSHEIRTPMNAVIGMAYLALKTDLTPRQHDYINKVHTAAKSLLGIINDILDFSKVEAGKMTLNQERFFLEEVAGNSLSMLLQSAREKEIELLFDLSDPLLLGESGALLGDTLRLGQVITNLLSNAIKFTHQGYVKLTITVDERTDDDVSLRFSVRDTGIGMSAEQVSRLFQEFTQADGSTTRKYGGTGLGLTISLRFIELMGGRIWVESASGEGSNFIFTAQFKVAKPVPQVAAVLPGVDVLRVLVVDDNPDARLVLIDMLTALGVGIAHYEEIAYASRGAEALDMLKQADVAGSPYDLLLLDWVMPEMDGGDVLKALQTSGMTRLPLSVIVSAYDSEAMRAAASGYGSEWFLSKPVLPDALRNILNSLTGSTANQHNPEYESGATANISGLRVLLVEDNTINQQLAVELLQFRGISVTVANNGQEAIDQLETVAPDYYQAVLMDLQMPIMDGYEATRRLRANPRYFSLPIIAMTAHAMAEERDHCHALGMNEHLSKPIEPDDLYAVLAHYAIAPAVIAKPAPIASSAPPAMHETTVLELPRVDGLNTTVGTRYAGNNAKLYVDILTKFRNDYMNYEQKFAQYFAGEQLPDAERLAHTIKGLTGTIGAKDVSQLADKLEIACKSRQVESIESAFASLASELTPLIAALNEQLPAEKVAEDVSSSPAGLEKLPDCLPKLLQLLASGESDAIDVWDEHQKAFALSLPHRVLYQVNIAMRDFDFDTAYQQLTKFSSTTQSNLTKD